jgi:Flp pilus assembly pilin Flp
MQDRKTNGAWTFLNSVTGFVRSGRRRPMQAPFAVIEEGALVAGTNADAVVAWWSFTIAAAPLVPVQQKRLALNRPLADRPYSLRQLLQHRAGRSEDGKLAAYRQAVAAGDEPWPAARLRRRAGAAAKNLSNRETDHSSSAWGSVEVWIFLIRPESMWAARIVRDAMKATLLRFTRDESAATPIEYGLIAFTIAVTIKLATILASAQTAIR